MSSQGPAVPAAIVVAGGLIAGGVYFGLRSSRPALPSPPASEAALQSPPTPPVEVSRAQVLADATAALEAQRTRVVADCWQPAAKAQGEPATMQLVYTFTFNAQGQQLARGVSVDRATGRPDVATCLSTAVHPLTIPAPGAPVSVDVPFRLP